jgi:NitT/TauT family transport system substrate-binding protein
LIVAGLTVTFWLKERRPITLAFNSAAIASAPVFVASDGALLGVKIANSPSIAVKPFSTGRFALDALITNQVEAATVADVPTVNALANHSDLRIILTLCESPIRIIARKNQVSSIEGLRGKRIGTFAGTSADYFLRLTLRSHNISANDVHIINMQPSDAVLSLQNNDIDAVSAWEPQAEAAIAFLGVSNAFVYEDTSQYRERFNLVTTLSRLQDSRSRADLLSLVQSLVDATQLIHDRPADSKALVARELGIDPNQLNAVWDGFIFPAGMGKINGASELPNAAPFFDAMGMREDLRRIQQVLYPSQTTSTDVLVDPEIVEELNRNQHSSQ